MFVVWPIFGYGNSVRFSCIARQAGPGTGSADSCHRSPETARGLQEGKGGGVRGSE